MLLSRPGHAESQGSQPIAAAACTNGLDVQALMTAYVQALMTAARETMLFPKQSCEKSQNTPPSVLAACTNDVNASDDGSVKTAPGKCGKQLSPSKIKVLTQMQPGMQVLMAELEVMMRRADSPALMTAAKEAMLLPAQSCEKSQSQGSP